MMKQEYKLLLLGIVAVTLLDIFASIASRQFNFNYALLSPISFIIYGLLGFFATKVRNLKTAVLLGAILGLFDSTIGLKISMLLNAYTGELKYQPTAGEWVITSILMIGFAALVALIGGGLTRMAKKKNTNV